jgi:hypothetical protein
MTSVWSSEQILALAPDAGSVKNGKIWVAPIEHFGANAKAVAKILNQ